MLIQENIIPQDREPENQLSTAEDEIADDNYQEWVEMCEDDTDRKID